MEEVEPGVFVNMYDIDSVMEYGDRIWREGSFIWDWGEVNRWWPFLSTMFSYDLGLQEQIIYLFSMPTWLIIHLDLFEDWSHREHLAEEFWRDSWVKSNPQWNSCFESLLFKYDYGVWYRWLLTQPLPLRDDFMYFVSIGDYQQLQDRGHIIKERKVYADLFPVPRRVRDANENPIGRRNTQ